MIRLNIVVEGQTEEEFVNSVLSEPLAHFEVFASCRCVETSRDKKRHKVHRGGLLDYDKAKRDLRRWMAEDQNLEVVFSTMFDLYALPNNFPGFEIAKTLANPTARVAHLEEAFRLDVNHPRFLPYIQLHEFEALLLSDPLKFDWEFLEHAAAIQSLVELAASFTSPELIDDGKTTAPSKRIAAAIPEYEGQKASTGPLIASKIGLPVLRRKCPHFNEWVTRLEKLNELTPGASIPIATPPPA